MGVLLFDVKRIKIAMLCAHGSCDIVSLFKQKDQVWRKSSSRVLQILLTGFQLPGITLGCALCSALFPVRVSPHPSHQSWVKTTDLIGNHKGQADCEQNLLVYHLHPSKLHCLCSCSAKSSTEFIFVHRGNRDGFSLCQGRCKIKESCMQLRETKLSAEYVLMGAKLLIKQPLRL